MNEVQEKDNFWLYIGIAVIAFAGIIFFVKSSGHNDYAAASKAIAEDSSNSAYRNDAIHTKGQTK